MLISRQSWFHSDKVLLHSTMINLVIYYYKMYTVQYINNYPASFKLICLCSIPIIWNETFTNLCRFLDSHDFIPNNSDLIGKKRAIVSSRRVETKNNIFVRWGEQRGMQKSDESWYSYPANHDYCSFICNPITDIRSKMCVQTSKICKDGLQIKEIWLIFSQLRLWIAAARHNLKWLKI